MPHEVEKGQISEITGGWKTAGGLNEAKNTHPISLSLTYARDVTAH